jgi:apolipoprotein D and lipocalin family protein
VIFELDQENYQYAFVSGPDTSYLWFLSRTPQVDESLVQQFVQRARMLGFDTDGLVFPEQDCGRLAKDAANASREIADQRPCQ